MRKLAPLLLGVFILSPAPAHAATVLINEIAWMGTAASANAEWLELANTTTAPIDLSGWTLAADSGSPSVDLAGSIGGSGFYLLERTSDASVPEATADQIYTGALSNSGATLTLRDAGGAVVDQVVGGDAWANVGGDNSTKATAQRTATGWTTAAGTPRTATAGAAPADATGAGSTAVPASGAASASPPPPTALTIDARQESPAFLNAPVRFSAIVKAKGGSIDAAAAIGWSFGDGSSGLGSSVEKTYNYPGTYVVYVEASDGAARASDELIIDVHASGVRIARITGDGVVIANAASEELDLSGWTLLSGVGSFRFPPGTRVLAASEALFPWMVMNLPVAFDARLLYPNGRTAATYTPPAPPLQLPSAAEPFTSLQEVDTAEVISVPPSTHGAETALAPAAPAEPAAAGAALAASAALASTSPADTGGLAGVFHSSWLLGILGAITVAGIAVMVL